MFFLNTGEYIAGKCSVANGINCSLVGQQPLGFSGEETPTSSPILPLSTVTATLFTATSDGIYIKNIMFTNVTSSDVTVTLYLNGTATANKFVSEAVVKAKTTVTLDSSGFTQFPVPLPTISGGGGSSSWGGISGNIEDQIDLVDNFSKRILNGTAGEAISSGMAVVIWTDGKIYKYNITNDTHAGLTCGIAKTSTSSDGEPITVTLPGNIHIESGSGWDSGLKYFISSTSVLITTPPTLGIVKLIGTGISVDTIFVDNYNEIITI